MTRLTIKQRIILTFGIISALAIYLFTDSLNTNSRRHYLEASEELMYDQVFTLRSFIYALRTEDDPMALSALKTSFAQKDSILKQTPKAKIYAIEKWGTDTQLYLTDKDGDITYHSQSPGELGKSYNHWRNISLALAGDYGARSTRSDKDDPSTSVLHVTLPIYDDQQRLSGTITLVKPVKRLSLYLNLARKKIVRTAFLTLALLILLCFYFTRRIVRPIEALTEFADEIGMGQRPNLPATPYGEIKILANTMQEMLKKLDGTAYVESYMQTLSHELKSPLAAMHGALELLDEASPEQAAKLCSNLRKETTRMNKMIENILFLSRLENQAQDMERNEIDLCALAKHILAESRERYPHHQFRYRNTISKAPVLGNDFLLQVAINNLVKNAVEFSPEESIIEISATKNAHQFELTITDPGQGIPDYALDKIFDRFYSLPRPNNGRKSSGLGLAIVREILSHHHGDITITSKGDQLGTQIQISLPIAR
ncbi:two-component system sensor histidine kinase CreC [Lentisphaera marina]|uniref:two-component system sensor histidine kinase CreC n=1 Tax=Lentisphaera marina TaxID=1111041 RepID=UPI002366F544|nr:two-component system sensor histidine kinase CreC [Lentisphaera marina]MDD7985530.1 two-component system sensor histidine kinase CreC [Lentisphaera marina]